VIGPDTYCRHDGYLPERSLARWLGRNGFPAVVYAFPRVGVQPLRAAYRRLITHLGATAVVIVDGGTDMLLRGDESDLGTPQEDMATLAAVAGITGPVKLAASVGFGIDAYHGVNHAQVLENIAALTADPPAPGNTALNCAANNTRLCRAGTGDKAAAHRSL